MPKKTENEIVALPYYERNGKASYPLPNAKIEDDLIIACPKVAEKIIPIIFLPGVMGTNLKKKAVMKRFGMRKCLRLLIH
ncbi:hypothetical protein QDZ74_004932 [Pluralibacter gergoviae]|uniref:hypothetical protein n=1 Tax=Pluralibacter gergoviae TaxID=61647 RepID=UPI000A6D43A2|nr:hypothetical protein [Pluralibacter gergoviae]EKW6621214.1 hypothetical protein [Pluralibacter gergoviae]